ncbi:DNA invertase Pin-like site-specific DNA recombinase [Salinibacter ruber]|uniref:recombinase family protein n=1 Tax=Salinibacter ruber TaxID=146919 RepID=UPI0021697B39|nr:recombinase family protein [Salinibacter ruber]MCS4047626.1 DNA invertase Pin-like site-specific DNA recombinase [Salinibacter ruber]
MNVGYARVSTGEQTLDLQTDELQEAGCEEIYTDKTSGAKGQRPGLEKALSYLREGDCLIVWKLDRLGRSLKDLIEKVQALGEEGCEFRSLKEGIDTTTPAGKLTFHIFGALAEFERDLIRERTKAGLRAARKRGKTGGRPPALDEGDIKMAQRLIQDPDVPVDTICQRLGISSATLYRYVGPDGSRRK